MKRLISLFVGVLVPVFIFAGVVSQPAMAQDKAKDAKEMKAPKDAKDMKDAKAAKAEKGKATVKVLHEDDKVRVVETTFKPGDEGLNVARPFHVLRALKGGTLQRTYADGKTEKNEFKTGEVKAWGPFPVFTPKNVGKSDVVLYVVQLKEPKK